MQNLMKASYLWLIPLEASCTEASDHVSLFNPSPPSLFTRLQPWNGGGDSCR